MHGRHFLSLLVALLFFGLLIQIAFRVHTPPQQQQRLRQRLTHSCESGEWVFADGNSSSTRMPSMGRWKPDPRCAYRDFSASEASNCLARFGDVLFIGDSIQRGLFWSLVGTLSGVGATSRSELLPHGTKVSVENNMRKTSAFSNVQDQTLRVSDPGGSSLFSIRFVYAAHASDFEGRCKAVNHWFFQCPAPLDEVLVDLLGEQDDNQKNRMQPDFGLIYLNVGMWDWRTGVPVAQFAANLAATLDKTASLLARGRHLLWRHSTAAYSSKFAWPKECKESKIRQDSRPCNIHTDGLFWYNRAVEDTLRTRHIQVLDAWPATATRPDLTLDGIHYNRGSSVLAKSAPHNYAWATTDKLDNHMYRVLNNQFLTSICPS